MKECQAILDMHTHSIASGHGTTDTITMMAQAAAQKGLKILGIADHGPSTPNSSNISYFRGLHLAPPIRYGVRILYGIELNILSEDGTVDLDDSTLLNLDYAIISMHITNYKPGTCKENTLGYINAMKRPNVKIIGHCDDERYVVDYEELVNAAIQNSVVFEINNASLILDSFRPNAARYDSEIIRICKKYNYPILLSSDSHGAKGIGNFTESIKIIEDLGYPAELVMNYNMNLFHKYFNLS